MPLKVFLVLQDLTKSQTGHTDEMSKVQRPAVFADINICLASAFSYQKRTLGLHEKEVTEAGKFVCLFVLSRCCASFAEDFSQSTKIYCKQLKWEHFQI